MPSSSRIPKLKKIQECCKFSLAWLVGFVQEFLQLKGEVSRIRGKESKNWPTAIGSSTSSTLTTLRRSTLPFLPPFPSSYSLSSKTTPGESIIRIPRSSWIDWRSFVWPGWAATAHTWSNDKCQQRGKKFIIQDRPWTHFASFEAVDQTTLSDIRITNHTDRYTSSLWFVCL